MADSQYSSLLLKGKQKIPDKDCQVTIKYIFIDKKMLINFQVGGAQDENLADEEEEKESNENRVLGIEHLNAGRNHFDEENSRPEIPLSHGNYDAEPTVQDQRNRSQNEVSRRQDAILSNYPSHQELPMNEQLADSGECDGPVD